MRDDIRHPEAGRGGLRLVPESVAAAFAMPVQVLRHRAVADPGHRIRFPEATRVAACPGSTIAGRFGHAVADALCRRAPGASQPCAVDDRDRGVLCERPADCAVPRLQKLRSDGQFPPPVLFRCRELDLGAPCDSFTLETTLWGRTALAKSADVERIVRSMGQARVFPCIGPDGHPARCGFAVSGSGGRSSPVTLLRAAVRGAPTPNEAFVVLETPLNLGKETVSRLRPDLGDLLPVVLLNAAAELVRWDDADRRISGAEPAAAVVPPLGERLRDARSAVREAAVRTRIEAVAAEGRTGLRRRSGGNGRTYPVAPGAAVTGVFRVAGDLEPLWPWLAVASLGGAGRSRSLGYGRIAVYTEAGLEEFLPMRGDSDTSVGMTTQP